MAMREFLRGLIANDFLSQAIMIAGLIMSRTVPIIFLVPFLGGRLVPPQTRMGLSVGLMLLVFPFAQSSLQGPFEVDFWAYVPLILKELMIGFMIGFAGALLFYAAEMGGRAVDTMRGSNIAEAMVPELGTRASPLGQFSFQFLLVVFCVFNGHALFINAVIESFAVVPIDQWPKFSAGLSEIAEQFMVYSNALIQIAFALVFPGIFASFMVDIVFGMFNRIAPQLNAYFMSLGVKSMVGIVMFMFALRLMVGELQHKAEDSIIFVRNLVQLLG